MHRVARADRAGRLRFAPLQGETARRVLPAVLREPMETAVLAEGAALHLRSDSVLRSWAVLPWPWRALAALRLVPRPLRDAAYRWVARHRERISLGPLEYRGALTAAEQARFLE